MQDVDQKEERSKQFKRLLPLLVARDQTAWEEASGLLKQSVLSALRRIFRDSVDVEEVWHDTWLTAHEKIEACTATFEGWVVTIAVRKGFDQLRRDRRTRVLDEVNVESLQGKTRTWFRNTGIKRALGELLDALPVRERTLLVLHYGEEHPWIVVGEALEITETAARQSGHRLMKGLNEACALFAGTGDDIIEAADARKILQRIVDDVRSAGTKRDADVSVRTVLRGIADEVRRSVRRSDSGGKR